MPLVDRLRARIGRYLEAGPRPTLLGRAGGAVYELAAARGVRRPLDVPRGLSVVGISGAVLGGAGKTPVAIALSRALARRGLRVALVSHAYRARPLRPREVRPFDHPREVGDDALASARLLEPDGVPVYVAPPRDRARALDLARAEGAAIVVVDGLLQARPLPLADAVLVLDALAPWGSGRCPPLGDLRAPRLALLGAADHVAVVTPSQAPPCSRGAGEPCARGAGEIPEGSTPLLSSIEGAASARGERLDVIAMRGLCVGLVLAVARPERIARALALVGIEPEVTLALGDHAALAPADLDRALVAAAPRRAARPDVWLTTPKCATKLPEALWGAPVFALDHRIDVEPLVGALRVVRQPAS